MTDIQTFRSHDAPGFGSALFEGEINMIKGRTVIIYDDNDKEIDRRFLTGTFRQTRDGAIDHLYKYNKDGDYAKIFMDGSNKQVGGKVYAINR